MARNEEEMADFTLTYDGPAVERMPVRELAPALVAMGDIFHEAHALVSPDAPPVDLEIRATERGSFDIGLHLATSDIVNLLTTPEAMAASTLITIVSGFFWFVKLRGGKKDGPRVEIKENTITIHVDNSTHITVPAAAKDLYDSPKARENAEVVVSPLRREGVDAVKLAAPQAPTIEVNKTDLDAFESAAQSDESDEESTETITEEMPLVAVQPALEGEARWRFKSGEMWIPATMKDQGFLKRVHEGREAFVAGDVLISRVAMKVWPMKPGQKPRPIEWSVLKVHRHDHVGGGDSGQLFPEEDSE